MDKLKIKECPYLLAFLSTYEKCKHILTFLHSPLEKSNNMHSGDSMLRIKDKQELAKYYIYSGILTENQVKLFAKFTDNRNKIAHEIWKLSIDYQKDYLNLGETLKELKTFLIKNKHIIDQYNSEVAEHEKIKPEALFDSIKKDFDILLDEKIYSDIFQVTNGE